MINRKKPSTHIGSDFRSTPESFGFNGEDKRSGDLMIGIAETTPCENTKEPTPRSICENRTVRFVTG